MRSSCIAKLRVRRLPRSLPISVSRTAPLSAWLKAAGVAIRKRGHTAAPPGPDETPEQEASPVAGAGRRA